MASKEAQISWRGSILLTKESLRVCHIEGSVTKILESLERGLRSGLSYSGARSITELHVVSEFVTQTSAGLEKARLTFLIGLGENVRR